VVAQLVAARKQEFGVRAALGASPRALVRISLLDGLRQTAAGLALGAVAALLLVPTLQGFSAMPDAIATTRRVVARRSKQTAIQTGRQVRGIAAKRPAARR